jgi:hypothetical protein
MSLSSRSRAVILEEQQKKPEPEKVDEVIYEEPFLDKLKTALYTLLERILDLAGYIFIGGSLIYWIVKQFDPEFRLGL